MSGVDWMGEHGGQMATAAAAASVSTAGVMTALGKWIAARVFEPTIKRLEEELDAMRDAREDDHRRFEDERRRDREEYRAETRDLRNRIVALEALLMQASGANRNLVQAAISETNVRVSEVAHGSVKIQTEKPE